MQFNLLDLIKYYFKNYVLALVIFLLVCFTGILYMHYGYEQQYIGTTTMMLGARYDKNDNENIIDNLKSGWVQNYIKLITSNKVLKMANEKSKLNYTEGQLHDMVNAYYEEETLYITIEVTSKNKKDSAMLSYNIYKSLIEEVERIFSVKNIYLVDRSVAGTEKYSSKYILFVIITIGLILSFLAATCNYLFFPTFDLQSKIKDIMRKMKKRRKQQRKIKRQRRIKRQEEKKKLQEVRKQEKEKKQQEKLKLLAKKEEEKKKLQEIRKKEKEKKQQEKLKLRAKKEEEKKKQQEAYNQERKQEKEKVQSEKKKTNKEVSKKKENSKSSNKTSKNSSKKQIKNTSKKQNTSLTEKSKAKTVNAKTQSKNSDVKKTSRSKKQTETDKKSKLTTKKTNSTKRSKQTK